MCLREREREREREFGATVERMTSETQLRMWFEQIDLDRNGLLSVREVQKCLALNNLTFSLTSTNMLMRLFDADHSGMLSFNQFVVYGTHQPQLRTYMSVETSARNAMLYIATRSRPHLLVD